MIDSGRPLLELEQLAAWATVRLLLNEPRLPELEFGIEKWVKFCYTTDNLKHGG